MRKEGKQMNYAQSIFEKATIRGITDYLMFGLPPEVEARDYNTRLDEQYDKFEKAIRQNNTDETIKLLDLANEMENETGSVYLEIGIQVGFLLVKDMIQNIGEEKQENISKIDYQEMYNSLFKDVSCALELLQLSHDEIANKACKILKKGQCRTEKIFVESE